MMRAAQGKTVRVLPIIIMLMIGVSGCMENNNNSNNVRVSKTSNLSTDERMVEYINGRYDDNFTYYNPKSDISDKYSRRILVESEKYPGEYITVLYSKSKEDGTEFFNDNYLYFVYKERTIEFLNEVLSNFFDYDLKFFYDMHPSGVNLAKLPADATFEEYVSNEASQLGFCAVLAPGYDMGDKELLPQKLKEAFAPHNAAIVNATVLFCGDSDAYGALSSENLSVFRSKFKGPELWISRLKTGEDRYEWGITQR